jgi:hypothetical protein
MTHKTKCKDKYGNAVPCHYSCKQMWSEALDITIPGLPDLIFDPADWSHNDSWTDGMWVPTLKSILGYAKAISSLALDKWLAILRVMTRVSVGWVQFMIKWAIYDSVMYLESTGGELFNQTELRKGIIDLNPYVEQVYNSIVNNLPLPNFVKEYIPTTLSDFDEGRIYIPQIEKFFDMTEGLLNDYSPRNHLWFVLGFTPSDLIPAHDWIWDAGGYVTERGRFGSEYVDDVIGIILMFLPYGVGAVYNIMESVHDVLVESTKYMRIYNVAAEAYNALRMRISLSLVTLVDKVGDEFKNLLTNSIVGEFYDLGTLPDDIFNSIKLQLYSLADKMDVLPEMPVFPEEVIEYFENTEFSMFDDLSIQGLIEGFSSHSAFSELKTFIENKEGLTDLILEWFNDFDEFLKGINVDEDEDQEDQDISGGSSSSDGSESDSSDQDSSQGEIPTKVRYLE